MSLIQWITDNFLQSDNWFLSGVSLSIVWLIVYDFYHLLFASVLSWFKKS